LWDKKFGAKGSSVQMPVVEQRLIESERDIMKLDIIDWNRLNGSWANSFDALQTIASWFAHKAYYTVVKHDLRFAPNIDWPRWKHAGSHEYLGHLYWNDFYYRQRGNLVFSDEPDFHGTLNHPDGGISHFWGDIGKVSAQIFALTQKELGAHDLWISVVDEHTQIIIEPFVNLRDQWASMLIKYAGNSKTMKSFSQAAETQGNFVSPSLWDTDM